MIIKMKDLLFEDEPKKKEQPPTSKKLKIDIPDDPFNSDDVNEGPSYEYANYMKKIEKAENMQAKEVNNLVKLLKKKGLKKEAIFLAGAYMKSMREFDDYIQKLMSTLN